MNMEQAGFIKRRVVGEKIWISEYLRPTSEMKRRKWTFTFHKDIKFFVTKWNTFRFYISSKGLQAMLSNVSLSFLCPEFLE